MPENNGSFKALEMPQPDYVIFFEDAEVPMEVFFDEDVALSRYESLNFNWNCHLFSRHSKNNALSKKLKLTELAHEQVIKELAIKDSENNSLIKYTNALKALSNDLRKNLISCRDDMMTWAAHLPGDHNKAHRLDDGKRYQKAIDRCKKQSLEAHDKALIESKIERVVGLIAEDGEVLNADLWNSAIAAVIEVLKLDAKQDSALKEAK